MVAATTNTSAPATTAAPDSGDKGPTGMAKLFVDVEQLPEGFFGILQILFLAACYSYILTIGGTLIKDGSELLLLIPKWAGLVGSVILPVLGAVPDGAIVLFSGMGPDAQKQLEVGIGALAGSTIMLLTVPWIVSIIAGRVNLDGAGNANYVRPRGAGSEWSKLMPSNKFMGTGVNVSPAIIYASKIMLLTALPFFVIQIPAMVAKCTMKNDEGDCETPKWAALASGILCVLMFAFYLWDQKRLSDKNIVTEGKVEIQRNNAFKNHLVGLRFLFSGGNLSGEDATPSEGTELAPKVPKGEKELRTFLKPFFKKYDTDGSGTIDSNELKGLLRDLGEKPDKDNVAALMQQMDADGSGMVDFNEFVASIKKALDDAAVDGENGNGSIFGRSASEIVVTNREQRESAVESGDGQEDINGGDDDDEEEEDEMPEEWASLSPAEQRKKILIKSFTLMTVGTIVVLLFSDPMVDVLSNLGHRSKIPPFYVAFVLAPLVSNGSEFIAAYAYAAKKTEKTISVSIATLLGAACMNNSFCLSIFLFLVFAKDLKWVFTAEVMSIVLVEIAMFILCLVCGRKHPTWTVFVVIAFFPLSLGLVAGLEGAGFD